MVVVLLLVVVVGVVAVVGFGAYNRLVKDRNAVENAAAQIDVSLKRRHDLIPNLVETVKGYATHERETLDAVITARSRAVDARQLGDRGAAEGALTQALGKLFALAEAYPNLKANEGFLELQQELTNTEDRISGARGAYNAAVLAYNTAQDTIPTRFFVGMAKASKAEYFDVPDGDAAHEVPQVRF